jgi:hypothetical protein
VVVGERVVVGCCRLYGVRCFGHCVSILCSNILWSYRLCSGKDINIGINVSVCLSFELDISRTRGRLEPMGHR